MSERATMQAEYTTSQERILIVDDDAEMASLIQKMLTYYGYTVVGLASTGREAIDKAAETGPDLVLMDINLRGDLDGIKAADHIRAEVDVPVIFLSAYADSEILHRAKITGPFGYLLKPFKERELLISIEMALYKHRIELKLRQSERRLSTVLRTIGDAVIATDTRGAVKFMNLAAEAWTGWRQEEALGKSLTGVFTLLNLKALNFTEGLDAIEHPRGVSTCYVTNVLVSKDGRHIPIEICFTPIYDEKDHADGLVLVFRDITERKRAENALRKAQEELEIRVQERTAELVKANEALLESEERYRRLVENLNDVIFTLDTDGRFTYVSSAIERISGYSASEMEGSPFNRFVYPDDLDSFVQSFQSVIRGKSIQLEFRFIDKNGEVLHTRASGRPVYENNRLTGISGVLTDSTESEARLRAEEQTRLLERQAEDLFAAREAAEQASSLKSEFVANMSHEIRTPLNGIIGIADLLRQTKLTPQQRGYVDIINTSGDVLLSLINDILDFSKIEAGKLTLESIHLKLRDLVEGTVQMMAEEAAKKGLELGCLVYKDVPDNLRGDPSRLRQLLLNLVSNAIKFTECGEVVVRVRSVVDESTRVTLRFAVSDTGVGISSAAKAMLFKPFIQADGSTTRKYGGTGLGLSITKRIIDLMGGTLGVESEVGKGSTFWFEVPFEEDVAESVIDGTRGPSSSVCDPDIHDGPSLLTTNTERQVRVLVVEDKEVNQIVLTSMLRRPGFRLDLVSNGREAIKAVQDVCYDIVFMDCHMPEVDGWEATFQIREMERETKNTIIVAITADALTGDKERCFAAGMDDYISKPVKLSALNRVLAKWIPTAQTAPSEPLTDTRDTGPDSAILDYARIQELRAVGGEDDAEVLRKTVSCYIEDTPSQIAELRQALETSDWHSIEMISHSLKGTSGNVGAILVVRHSRTLEKNARAWEPQQIHAIIDDIESEFERVHALLKEELKPQREEKI